MLGTRYDPISNSSLSPPRPLKRMSLYQRPVAQLLRLMPSSAAPGNCHDLSGTGKERRRCRSRFPWARLHGENSSVHPRSIRLRRSYIRRSVLFCTWPRLIRPDVQQKSISIEANNFNHARRTIIQESRRAMSLPIVRRNDLWLGELFHLGSLPVARLPSTIRYLRHLRP